MWSVPRSIAILKMAALMNPFRIILTEKFNASGVFIDLMSYIGRERCYHRISHSMRRIIVFSMFG